MKNAFMGVFLILFWPSHPIEGSLKLKQRFESALGVFFISKPELPID
jgi:hypothetical protein